MSNINEVAVELLNKIVRKNLEDSGATLLSKPDANILYLKFNDINVNINFNDPDGIEVTGYLAVPMANGEMSWNEFDEEIFSVDVTNVPVSSVEKRLNEIAKSLVNEALSISKRYKKLTVDEYMDIKHLDAPRKSLKNVINDGWVPHTDCFVLSPNNAPFRAFILEKNNKSIMLLLNQHGFEVLYPEVKNNEVDVRILSGDHEDLADSLNILNIEVSGRFFSFTGDGLSSSFIKKPEENAEADRLNAFSKELNKKLSEIGQEFSQKLSNPEASVDVELNIDKLDFSTKYTETSIKVSIDVNASKDGRKYGSGDRYSHRIAGLVSDMSTDRIIEQLRTHLDNVRLSRTTLDKVLKNGYGDVFSDTIKDLKHLFKGMDTTFIMPVLEGSKNAVFTKDGSGFIYTDHTQNFYFEDTHPELGEMVYANFTSPKGMNGISTCSCNIASDRFNTNSIYSFERHLDSHAKLKLMAEIANKF